MSGLTADIIIVGGGLSGCALASRLSEDSSLGILLIEAGTDERNNVDTTTFKGALNLLTSEFNWNYQTINQPETLNRSFGIACGKALGGGSILNFGGWSRGDSRDYDEWADLVDDQEWSYKGLLPYFLKTETFVGNKDSKQYGTYGPMKVTTVPGGNSSRKYPLRDTVLSAWKELGYPYIQDPTVDRARPGTSEWIENWDNGKRQPSYVAYDLSRVQVITSAIVDRVVFNGNTASAIITSDGREFKARKEVILCAGTFRSPQILMLSGIGEKNTLDQFKIDVIHENPQVGKNLMEHFCLFQLWQLEQPEKPLAFGHPNFIDNDYSFGPPFEWTTHMPIPQEILQPALTSDDVKEKVPIESHNLLSQDRSNIEAFVAYSSIFPGAPVDGSHILTSTMLLHPVARGTISLASKSIDTPPIIDPKHFSRDTDRVSMIHGVREVLKLLLQTESGKSFVNCESASPGLEPLTISSSDAEIDNRLRAAGLPHFHSSGTLAMGKVVDTDFKVYGVNRLRVVDASIFPVAVGSKPQATLYAIAEKAAETILKEYRDVPKLGDRVQ